MFKPLPDGSSALNNTHIYTDDIRREISGVIVERGYSNYEVRNGEGFYHPYVKTYEFDETDPSNTETLLRLLNEGWRNIDGRYEKVVDTPEHWRLHMTDSGEYVNV